jgi:hypothetical protein
MRRLNGRDSMSGSDWRNPDCEAPGRTAADIDRSARRNGIFGRGDWSLKRTRYRYRRLDTKKKVTGKAANRGFSSRVYPKSLAFDLHSDSLRIEGEVTAEHERYPKVDFIHFSGVAPRRYRDFFESLKRKRNNGKFREWMATPPRPNIDVRLPVWCTLEDFEVDNIRSNLGSTLKKLRKMQFSPPTIEDETETKTTSN